MISFDILKENKMDGASNSDVPLEREKILITFEQFIVVSLLRIRELRFFLQHIYLRIFFSSLKCNL